MIGPHGGIVSNAKAGSADSKMLAEARRVLLATLSAKDSRARSEAFAAWMTMPPREFKASEGLLVADIAEGGFGAIFVVLEFEGFPGEGYAHQAYLTFEAHRGWAVEWILGQCTSCFGIGVIYDTPDLPEVCGTCGGFGWGFPISRAFRYVPEEIAAAR